MLNDFLAEFAPLLIQGTIDTLVMGFASTAVAYMIGTVLGVVLHLTAPNGLRPVPVLNAGSARSSVSCCTSPRRTVCVPCPC